MGFKRGEKSIDERDMEEIVEAVVDHLQSTKKEKTRDKELQFVNYPKAKKRK